MAPSWLQELLKNGLPGPSADPEQPTTLERTYALPETTLHTPAFSPSLPEEIKALGKNVWIYDARRTSLFRSVHFLLLQFDRITTVAPRLHDLKDFIEKMGPASLAEHVIDSENTAGANELLIAAEVRKVEKLIQGSRACEGDSSICVILSPPRISGEKGGLWDGILALLKR